MFNTIVGAGAVGAGAGAASRYDAGSDQNMRLLAAPAPAPQHWYNVHTLYTSSMFIAAVSPRINILLCSSYFIKFYYTVHLQILF
jgi:hypothetical protein